MVRFSVLVADDEKMPREILRDHLPWEELGVERVEEAEDGAQALELARVHRPDIIISDVKMPRMNGLELAGAVREMYPECQFIFLSGYTDKEYLKGAIKLRAASYVENRSTSRRSPPCCGTSSRNCASRSTPTRT